MTFILYQQIYFDLQFKRQVKTLPCTVTLGLELVSAGASLYPPEISVEKGTVAKKWCGWIWFWSISVGKWQWNVMGCSINVWTRNVHQMRIYYHSLHLKPIKHINVNKTLDSQDYTSFTKSTFSEWNKGIIWAFLMVVSLFPSKRVLLYTVAVVNN